MNNLSQKISRGGVPRLAMINDIAGFGRCSTTAALPVISAMGVQVCPVPTSILSNHLGFPVCESYDYTPHMRGYIGAWKKLGLSFDGLYCGFLTDTEQTAIVEEFLSDFAPPLFLLDPVMGDHGKRYRSVTKEHAQALRRLCKQTKVLTPNLTEACLLTDTPYRQDGWSEEELALLYRKLTALCPGAIVITGLREGGNFLNICLENGRKEICVTPEAGKSRPGTGDLFASVLTAGLLQGNPLVASVRKAADFVALCISGTEAAGIPVQEGVLFEKYLSRLTGSRP